jgi:LysM repeat protein/GH24 family phage-related lysozyme (muramidase)
MNNMIKPHKSASKQDYKDQLFAQIAEREDNKPELYVGTRGVPTIGPGVELIVKDGVYKTRNRGDIDDYLTAAYGRPFKLSDADWLRMNNAAAVLNQKGLSLELIRQAVKSSIAGHNIIPLPAGGGRRLFSAAVSEAERNIDKEIRQAAKLAGIDPDAAVAAFANSHERQALVSLRYNNVKSPKAIAALLNGNRAEAYLEIAYRSNGSKEAGFVKRRMTEAADVLGDPKTWSPDQKRQWNDVFTRNRAEIAAYEKQFGANIPPTGFFSHHVKQAGHTLPAGSDVRRISVHPGETLGGIAKREGVSVQDLMKANNITNPKNLKSGSTLSLPPAPVPENQPEQQGGSLLDGEPVTQDVARASKPAKPARPETTPERDYMAKAVAQDVDPVEHTLLKPTAVLTETEVDGMIGHDAYWLTGNRHPLGDPLQNKTRDYFETFYPDDQRGAKPTPMAEPRPLAIAHGVPLSFGRETVAEQLAGKAVNSNIPDTVRGFQQTLNRRGYANGNRVLPNLKEDGEFGPRTLARLDEELLRDGPSSVIRDLNGMRVA